MRHGKKFNHLGRKTAHRKAMLSNMACSLIEHKRINTTVAKAKALRGFVEPILTKAKTDSTHSRRSVFRYLQNKDVVNELFREVAPKIIDRQGGYTRIIRTGYRLGDNAEMCLIELVDFNELYTNESAKKTTRRSRRGGGKTKAVEAVAEDSSEVELEETIEAVVEESPEAEATDTEEAVMEETSEVEAEDTTEAIVEETPEAEEIVEEVAEETPEVEAADTEEVVLEETPEVKAEDNAEVIVEDTLAAEETVPEAPEVEDTTEEVAEETPAAEADDKADESTEDSDSESEEKKEE